MAREIEMSNLKKILILVAMILIFLPLKTVSADAPPPSMDFEFHSQTSGAALTIMSGKLYDCGKSDCKNETSIPIYCDETTCHAIAGYSSYQLEIRFSDGTTRRSNIFQNNSAYTVYKVTIRPDDLLVETQSTSGYQSGSAVFELFLIICICLTGILVMVVLLIIFLRRHSRKQK